MELERGVAYESANKGGILYSVHFDDQEVCEYDRFFEDPECRNAPEFWDLHDRLMYMVDERGFDKSFFKHKNYPDPACALHEKGQLRLYCLRYAKDVLVAGNGGIKPADARALQEDPRLTDAFERILYAARRIRARREAGELRLGFEGFEARFPRAFRFEPENKQ